MPLVLASFDLIPFPSSHLLCPLFSLFSLLYSPSFLSPLFHFYFPPSQLLVSPTLTRRSLNPSPSHATPAQHPPRRLFLDSLILLVSPGPFVFASVFSLQHYRPSIDIVFLVDTEPHSFTPSQTRQTIPTLFPHPYPYPPAPLVAISKHLRVCCRSSTYYSVLPSFVYLYRRQDTTLPPSPSSFYLVPPVCLLTSSLPRLPPCLSAAPLSYACNRQLLYQWTN